MKFLLSFIPKSPLLTIALALTSQIQCLRVFSGFDFATLFQKVKLTKSEGYCS
jgi:hypothetical protein